MKSDDWAARPAHERAAWKVQAFGDDAPLLRDEAAAILGVSIVTFLEFGIPCCQLSEKGLAGRLPRWRWAAVRAFLQARELAA